MCARLNKLTIGLKAYGQCMKEITSLMFSSAERQFQNTVNEIKRFNKLGLGLKNNDLMHKREHYKKKNVESRDDAMKNNNIQVYINEMYVSWMIEGLLKKLKKRR